jgi:hypothetical protein
MRHPRARQRNLLRAPGEVQPLLRRFDPPHADESLLGFVVRACEGTTIVHVEKALALGGVNRPLPYYLPTRLAEESEFSGLATLLRTTPDEIRLRAYRTGSFAHAPSSETIDFFGVRIRAQYRRPQRRRVSPRALRMRPYHRAIWELMPFSFDPETMEMLVTHCPECGRRLGWRRAQGIANCENCVRADGRPKVDLRDHPQAIVTVDDPEALHFVIALIHPIEEKKCAGRTLLRGPWEAFSNSDLFEVVMGMASGLLAEPESATAQGRPKSEDEFSRLTPRHLALAGRAILSGDEGFAVLAEEYRTGRNLRPRFYGLRKEYGPLSYVPSDQYLAPKMRELMAKKLGEQLRRQQVVQKKGHESQGDDDFQTVQRLRRQFDVSSAALRRLSRSGSVEVRRVSAAQKSPVLMSYAGVAPLVALYKDCILDLEAAGRLGVPRYLLPMLGELGHLERLTGKVLGMTISPIALKRSSVERLRVRFSSLVKSPPPAQAMRLRNAAAWLGLHPPPWLRIFTAVLERRLEVFANGSLRSNMLKYLFVKDVASLFEAIGGRDDADGVLPERLDIGTVAEILQVNEGFVWRFAKQHPKLLRKHDNSYTPFRRIDAERIAKRYIFVPEISRLSGITQRKVRSWLRNQKVHEAFTLQKNRQFVFLREKVEPLISSPRAEVGRREVD